MKLRRKIIAMRLRPGQRLEITTLFRKYRLYAQFEVEANLDDKLAKAQAELVAGMSETFMGLGAIVDDTTEATSYDSLRRASYPIKAPRYMDLKDQGPIL